MTFGFESQHHQFKTQSIDCLVIRPSSLIFLFNIQRRVDYIRIKARPHGFRDVFIFIFNHTLLNIRKTDFTLIIYQ